MDQNQDGMESGVVNNNIQDAKKLNYMRLLLVFLLPLVLFGVYKLFIFIADYRLEMAARSATTYIFDYRQTHNLFPTENEFYSKFSSYSKSKALLYNASIGGRTAYFKYFPHTFRSFMKGIPTFHKDNSGWTNATEFLGVSVDLCKTEECRNTVVINENILSDYESQVKSEPYSAYVYVYEHYVYNLFSKPISPIDIKDNQYVFSIVPGNKIVMPYSAFSMDNNTYYSLINLKFDTNYFSTSTDVNTEYRYFSDAYPKKNSISTILTARDSIGRTKIVYDAVECPVIHRSNADVVDKNNCKTVGTYTINLQIDKI